MSELEPPSTQTSIFMIGRDSDGHWVVQDPRGLHGGLFVDRTQALKFALFENGNRPQAVVMVPGVLELDMSGKASAPRQPAANTDVPREQRVA